MIRKSGLILAILMIGMSFSAAVSQGFVLAEETSDSEAYDQFWSILSREAELIAKLNSTNNATLAQELIQNSRLGAFNAVNISAQIWQNLEELKTSGVKTYYSAEELKEMAENITQNGLPEETVQELKSQGWSDEEIKALEDYIAENKDNITTGFNMTAFLRNLSTAFIKVAFKYNSYEAWGWKKLLNANATSLNLPVLTTWKEKTSTPFIWQKLKEFNKTFQNASLEEKLSLIENLKKQIINFSKDNKETVISSTSKTIYAKNRLDYPKCSINPPNNQIIADNINKTEITAENLIGTPFPGLPKNFINSSQLAVEYHSITKSRKVIVQGDYVIIIIITRTYNEKLSPTDCSIHVSASTSYELYYWNAFKALEKLNNLEALLKAEELGNNNPHLNELIQNTTSQLGEYFKTSLRGEYVESKSFTNPLKQEIKVLSSKNPTFSTSEEGYLAVGVSVVKEEVTKNYATYRVEVSLEAEDNTVSSVNVEVSGSELSDSVHYNLIHPDDGVVTWYSKPSGKIYGNDIVTVSGTVTVTYTPNHNDMPTSVTPPNEGLSSDTNSKTVTISYSGTIHLGGIIDKNRIQFQIIPSDSHVEPDETVTFYVRVINNNDAPINGSYELNIAVPTENGRSETITKRGWVSVNSNDNSGLIPVTTVTYPTTGTYGYSGTFEFNGYEKQDSGDIIVQDNNGGNSGSLNIESVDYSPELPKSGEVVNFTVKVKNTYSTSQNIKLELFVDDNLVDSTQNTINANSEGNFILHWLAQKGEHSYTIKAYSIIGGQKFEEDEKSGNIIVQLNRNDEVCEYGDYWISWLDVIPTLMVGDGKVHVRIKATYCQPLPDVGGGRILLLDLRGDVYVDNNKVHSFNTLNAGESLSVGETKVIDEFDWPLNSGNHSIILKVKNLSGLQEDIKNKTDIVTVEVLPHNEYPLKLTDISCNDLNFNFEASNYYTQGNYVSPLECTLKFKNVEDTPIYITDLSTGISISPPDLEKAIPDHITVSVNEDVKPSESITIRIQDKAVTTDRQMLLRVDGITATLYLDYTIEGRINGISKIAGKGVAESTLRLSVNEGIVYADVTADLLLLIEGPKVPSKLAKWFPIINKIPKGKEILSFILGYPAKNFILSKISEHQG